MIFFKQYLITLKFIVIAVWIRSATANDIISEDYCIGLQ